MENVKLCFFYISPNAFLHYLNGESAGDDGVNPVGEGIELLVAATDHVVFEEVTRPAVKLKQSHVELHGEVYSIKYTSYH